MEKAWLWVAFAVCFATIQTTKANCMLSMKNDLAYNQPLILSSVSGSWQTLDSSNTGFLQLSTGETVRLVCPSHPASKNAFANFPTKTEVLAKCDQGNRFSVDNKAYPFNELQCAEAVKPVTQKTGTPCFSGATESIKVGYETGGGAFVPAYQVCFDKEKRSTIYTESEVSPNFSKNDAPVRESQWVSDDSFGSANLEREYTCEGQTETFYNTLGKNYFQPGERCCYAKAQLVPAKDLVFGTQQLAAYHYLNSVPMWSTCNNRANWVEVEDRVRSLALRLKRPLQVWTGGFRVVQIRNKWLITTSDMYMHYTGKNDRALKIPLYVWKVVHDPQTRHSLAIIMINKPALTQSDLESHKLCRDICYNANWMNFLKRENIESGYVYCCDLNDFIFAFQMQSSSLPKNAGLLLRD